MVVPAEAAVFGLALEVVVVTLTVLQEDTVAPLQITAEEPAGPAVTLMVIMTLPPTGTVPRAQVRVGDTKAQIPLPLKEVE